jgi:hypothetical protein
MSVAGRPPARPPSSVRKRRSEREGANVRGMSPLRARVQGGRLVLDEAIDLPEGTEVPLALADGGDELDEAEWATLEMTLERSWAQAQARQTAPAEAILARLRARSW